MNGVTKPCITKGWNWLEGKGMVYVYSLDVERRQVDYAWPVIDHNNPQKSRVFHGRAPASQLHPVHLPAVATSDEDVSHLCGNDEHKDAYRRWRDSKRVFSDLALVPWRAPDGALTDVLVTFQEDADMLATVCRGAITYRVVAGQPPHLHLRTAVIHSGYLHPVRRALADHEIPFVELVARGGDDA